MGAVRNLASQVLSTVLSHAPPEAREWAEAMLRELDYIDGDWAALFWALGSTTAIFRRWGWKWLIGKIRQSEEKKMENLGKKQPVSQPEFSWRQHWSRQRSVCCS